MTQRSARGWLGWNSSGCTHFGICHASCKVPCGSKSFKLDWMYFEGCTGLVFKNGHCANVSSVREAFPYSNYTVSPCPPIAVNNPCHHASYYFGTTLLGGAAGSHCTPDTQNCGTGAHKYYGEANRVLMTSLGVTTTNSNLYAKFLWNHT
jgi:hypothetical protein